MFSEETELLCYSRYGKKILKLAYEAHQGIVKTKKFFELVFFLGLVWMMQQRLW